MRIFKYKIITFKRDKDFEENYTDIILGYYYINQKSQFAIRKWKDENKYFYLQVIVFNRVFIIEEIYKKFLTS